MQLKRDTDYALRLIFCAAKYSGKKGMSLTELCRYASVPRTIASRLCIKLTEAELLKESREESQSAYLIADDIGNKTLLDVALATEGTVDIFAVFDHSTELYSCGRDAFVLTEQQLTKALSEISFRRLIDNCREYAESRETVPN